MQLRFTLFSVSVFLQPPEHYITGCSNAIMVCFQWGKKNNEMNFVRRKMKHYTMKKISIFKSTNVSKEGFIKQTMCQCAIFCDSICQMCVSMRQCITDFCCSSSCSLHLCKTRYCSNCPLLSPPFSLICCDLCRLAGVHLNVVHLRENVESNLTATIITL